MKPARILTLDAAINFALGFLLLLSIPFPDQISNFLGVPEIQDGFYPSILGGVLVGIGIALILERYRKLPNLWVGLGLGGAIAINMCGGIILIGWLLFGKLELPLRGSIFLWGLSILLIWVSGLELFVHRIERKR